MEGTRGRHEYWTILTLRRTSNSHSLALLGTDTVKRQRFKCYCLPSNRYHFRYGPNKAYIKGVYANDDEYFADVAKAYQTELKILYDAGLRNGQVDDPNLISSVVDC